MFLSKDYNILRIYGFIEAPYMFPSFLKTRLFPLEFIRHSRFTKKKHFLKYKKGCNIKFHYTVSPFVINSSLNFPIVEKLLESMEFQEDQKTSYDPRKIIASKT